MKSKESEGKYKVLFVCGGSGGHINPALCTAEELEKKLDSTDILFVTTSYEIDQKMFHPYPHFKRQEIDSPRRPRGLRDCMRFISAFFYACYQAFKIIQAFRPDTIIGYGGYIQVPIIVIAWFFRIPVILHEQNIHPGISNRFMSFFAKKIALSHVNSKKFFITQNLVITGMPVKKDFKEQVGLRNRDAHKEFTVLIVGGSQGAHNLNTMVVKAVKLLPISYVKRLRIFHISGQKDCKCVEQEYMQSHINAKVDAFYDDMHSLYQKADLIVSRAGAGTLAEISASKLPSILVPYPYAGRHQYQNAKVFVDKNAAVLCDELKNTAFDLSNMIRELMDDWQRCRDMGIAAGTVSADNAAEQLADEVVRLVSTGKRETLP